MDAVKFLQERSRMYESGAATPRIGLEDDYDPASAVKVIEEWSAAHPRKTRQSVFLEQWPEASISEHGVLAIDSCKVEKSIKCNGMDCARCRREFWMQEVE